jgi:hypothetical protein
VKVLLQQGGTAAAPARPREVLRYVHSADQRPYIHPLREPASGAALTALRPDDHPWQYGVFTGLTDVNGVDFWHEKGWIRSRGLEKVRELDSGVEIISRSDWLTDRRGGKRLLEERQKIYIHAPPRGDDGLGHRLHVGADCGLSRWSWGQHEYGGLAFRPPRALRPFGRAFWPLRGALRREQTAGPGRTSRGDSRRPQVVGDSRPAWRSIDHPQNPATRTAGAVDDQGLINPAVSARGPLSRAKGAPGGLPLPHPPARGARRRSRIDAE